MTGSDEIGMELFACKEELIEFYFTVAKYIRIWSATPFIFRKHIFHHPGPVLFTKINHMKGDTDFFGNHFGKENIFIPWTIGFEQTGLIVPVDHKHGNNIISLLFKKICCHA